MTWRKGCLCGCLIPDECQYVDNRPDPVEVIVYHVHRAPVPVADVVAGEVIDQVAEVHAPASYVCGWCNNPNGGCWNCRYTGRTTMPPRDHLPAGPCTCSTMPAGVPCPSCCERSWSR